MGFPGGSVVKKPPTKQEMQIRSLGQEDPLEEGMATHSSSLARKIPWTESLVDSGSWGRKKSDITEVTGHSKTQKLTQHRKATILKEKLIFLNLILFLNFT